MTKGEQPTNEGVQAATRRDHCVQMCTEESAEPPPEMRALATSAARPGAGHGQSRGGCPWQHATPVGLPADARGWQSRALPLKNEMGGKSRQTQGWALGGLWARPLRAQGGPSGPGPSPLKGPNPRLGPTEASKVPRPRFLKEPRGPLKGPDPGP